MKGVHKLKEYAAEIQARLDAGYTLEQSIQPIFGHVVLDQAIIKQGECPIIVGLLRDMLAENYIVAFSKDYAKDGITPV